jgi:aminoglycoside phosphotransferase (APT) family kinase protein
VEIRGIHVENVSRFFREHIEGGDGPLEFQLIGDGRSNLTYRVRCGERSWVLRRPPLGHVLPTAHDMGREFRVIAGLGGTGVPVPDALAFCPDPALNEQPFYVMSDCPGVVIAADLPPGYASSEGERRALSTAFVDTLVALHGVDAQEVGLGDLGRPDGYLARQVQRWSQQWERSRTADLPAIDELIRRLQRAIPVSPPPAIVHGDYRLGNLAFAADDPGRVVAVYDWEMATLGDPLADLGYTLIYWSDTTDLLHGALRLSPASAKPGFLTRAEIVDVYAKRTGTDVSAVEFYEVLALYKLAVILEGIYARHLKGQTYGEQFGDVQRGSTALAQRALAIADAASDPKLRA